MTDERSKLKTGLILITYTVLLYVIVSNLSGLFTFFCNVIRILSPFLYGIGIAYILNILMRLFDRLYSFLDRKKTPLLRKMKRPLSILSVFLSLAVIVYALMVFAIPQLSSSVTSLASNIPEHISSFERFLNTTIQDLGLMGGFWKRVSLNWNEIIQNAGTFISDAFPQIFGFTKSLSEVIVNFATGILIAIYLLASKEKLMLILRKLIYAWLPKKMSNKIIDTSIIANRIFMGYFSGMILNALLLGLLGFIGFLLIKIPYAFLLSMIIAVTAIIPVLGPLIGSVLSIIIVLMVDPKKALLATLFLILLQELDSLAIYPRIVGRSIGMGGLWLLVSLILGGSLFGIVGMIAGIPTFALIYAIIRRMTEANLHKKNMIID